MPKWLVALLLASALVLAVATSVLAVLVVVEFPGSVEITGTSEADIRIAALQAQTAEMKRSEDRMLLVVMTMLGLAVATILTSLASGAYVFTRMHDRDVNAITKTVATSFDTKLDRVASTEREARNQLSATLRLEILDAREAAIKLREDYYGNLDRNLASEVATQTQIMSLQSQLDEANENYSGALQSRVNILQLSLFTPENPVFDFTNLQLAGKYFMLPKYSDALSGESLSNAEHAFLAMQASDRWKANKSAIVEMLERIQALREERAGSERE